MPLHACKQKSVARSINDILDYGKNPAKTDGGRLVSCYECDPETCNEQFLMKKQVYEQVKNRKEPNTDRNVLAYQIRQSFSPEDNITPEEANRLGMELARRFFGDNHQLVVCTHIDTLEKGGVIHNHIYANSTSLDCSRKFDNEYNSAFRVQDLSDEICRENGLSVVEEKGDSGVDYGTYLDKKNGIDWKAMFKADIDELLPKCKTVEELKQGLQTKGYTLRGKKTLSITHPNRKRGMRTERLDNKMDYSLAGLEYAIKHGRMLPKSKQINLLEDNRINLLRAIEGKTGGLKNWTERQNLKELAKSYSYLQRHGISSYDVLTAKHEQLTKAFNLASDRMKHIEKNMEQLKALRAHIVNYAKTVDTYKAYQSMRRGKDKFYDEHQGELLLHENSVQAFKSLGVRKLPKTAELTAKLDSLKMEKAEVYKSYQQLRTELREIQPVKQNLDSFLSEPQAKGTQEQER